MKSKLPLILILAGLIVFSGCTQLEEAQEGASNLICLARGNYNCVKQSYGPSSWQDNETSNQSSDSYSSIDEMGLVVSRFDLENPVRGYDSDGIIKIENKGGRDLKATDIDVKLKIFGNVSYLGNNTFKVPIEWGFSQSLEELDPGDSEAITFKVPTSKKLFNPNASEEYRENCEDSCIPEELPWEFDSNLKVSYNYEVPVVFSYKVYNEEYYKSHTQEVEQELDERCEKYKGSEAQVSSTSDQYTSPVSIMTYARSCKIFQGERFPLKIESSSLESFEILDDSILTDKGCERESDLKGNESSPVEWSCEMEAPKEVEASKTQHVIFKLPYRVHLEKPYSNSLKILKE